MAVSYLGTVYGTQAALKRMRLRNSGCIIQVGSALAYRGIPLQSAYCGAKFAARGFTDSLRAELLHDKSAIHLDRKSTRLNSSHVAISYAVFCLKKKKRNTT